MKVTDKTYKWTLFFYRCFIFFAIYCICFGLYIVFNPGLKEGEKKTREKVVSSEKFRRGNIMSFDGKPLAAYYPEYTLYADFGVGIRNSYTVDERKVTVKKSENPVKLDTFRINIYKKLAGAISKNIGGNANTYYREFYNYRLNAENKQKSGNRTGRKWYTENILTHKIDVFRQDSIIGAVYSGNIGRNTTGIYTRETGKRMYPFGNGFAHSAIGVVSEQTTSGIEKMYNAELKNGENILTTIDTRMQDICETILQDGISSDSRLVGGTIILMEVATGDIKAIANAGAYYKEKYTDTRDIYNNATKATIEPGSTFKTVSLMLALETGKVRLSDKFNTKMWRNDTLNIETNMLDSFLTVSRIIEHSSNTGTGNMVDKAFGRNANKFIQAIKALKITDKIDNIDETRPFINQNNSKESILKISYGYQVKLAPVHILSFYNAIANNGVMVKPRIVRGTVNRKTGISKIFKPEIINKSICSKSTLDSVRLTLSRVVGRGSARQIAGSKYGIAGKTGTAKIWLENVKNYETPDKLSRDMSSFCGYFPQKNPKYSCIVALYTRCLNEQELKHFYASNTAVPMFRQISDKIYALHFNTNFVPLRRASISSVKNTTGENLSIISEKLDLPISVDADADAGKWFKIDTANKKFLLSKILLKNGIVPDVTGMGLRDAVFLLENRKFKVSYSGTGTVVKQSPESGTPYSAGQKIHLTLELKTL
ncbi:MAG: PASTA domain-containing protein [Prevotellaceae bacterium]|jgi:cell division protein FtsI (penicillin-binding protein 3)|nr:PASTA domain-containing protein [Prevotellaceae bacterium]